MEQLGIEPKLLVAQIVNFLIIFLVLSKLLYKPIISMLEKRKKEIAEGLALTDKMRQEEEKLQNKKEEVLQEARKEAKTIVDAGKKEAESQVRDIIANAHKEAEGIIQKGKEDVEEQRGKMEKDVRRAAVEIAAAMTRRILTSSLSSADQHKVLAKQLKSLESLKA